MATPPNPIGPPQAPLFENGALSKAWFWYLYQVFTTAQQAVDLAVLEALDAGTEFALLPALRDLAAQAVLSLEAAPGVSPRQLEELRALVQIEPEAGLTKVQLEEVRALVEAGGCPSLAPRLEDLEKLVAMLADTPVTPPAKAVNVNATTSPTTTPLGGTAIPPGTPLVGALPSPLDPLSVIGQLIDLNGVPYLYVAGLGAGPAFWQQVGSTAVTIRDTHANRASYPAANYPQGTVYLETDRTLYYMVQFPAGVATWVFFQGTWISTYSNLPTLGINDRWVQFFATDFLQGWYWDGAAWHFAPGSSSGYSLQIFPGLTTLPPGVWGLCDGSTYSITQDDATLVNFTTSVIANTYIRR